MSVGFEVLKAHVIPVSLPPSSLLSKCDATRVMALNYCSGAIPDLFCLAPQNDSHGHTL